MAQDKPPSKGDEEAVWGLADQELYERYLQFLRDGLQKCLDDPLLLPDEEGRVRSEFDPESPSRFLERLRAMSPQERAEYEDSLRIGYGKYSAQLTTRAREAVREAVQRTTAGSLPASIERLFARGCLPAEQMELIKKHFPAR